MRDAFAVLFFVSVGMLLDPIALLDNAGLVAGAIGIVLLGKSAAAFAVVRLLRYPVATALLVALALAQIGEFSFILAALGRDLEILPPTASNVLVATSVVSITLNPLIFRLLGPLSKRLGHKPSLPPEHEKDLLSRLDPSDRAVVVGYGHVGQTVSRLLREHNIEPTIVELNHRTVASLREQGMLAIYGDATQAGVLQAAGVETAGSLIFAASGTPPQVVIQTARAMNPRINILARSTYLSEVIAARQAGADFVVSAEAEVAFAMAEHLLRRLGATPDQLDRARDDLRASQPRASAPGDDAPPDPPCSPAAGCARVAPHPMSCSHAAGCARHGGGPGPGDAEPINARRAASALSTLSAKLGVCPTKRKLGCGDQSS